MSPIAWKGSVITAILALAPVASGHGQIAHVYGGFTGGATYNNITDYEAINSDWRWGDTAGLMAGWVTSKSSYNEEEHHEKGSLGSRDSLYRADGDRVCVCGWSSTMVQRDLLRVHGDGAARERHALAARP